MMGDEVETKKKRVALESLGWLTESSIMPKKQRAIEGVGASSILELKAQLYKSQEDSKRVRLSSDLHLHRAKHKITARDPFSAKNSGVEARAAKDKLELKAIRDGAASYAALEKKAELYDKLVRGEISDEEDQEKYSVDFFRKGLEQDESRKSQGHETHAAGGQGHDHGGGDDDDDDDDDISTLSNVGPAELGRTSSTVDRQEHKRFVKEVHEEAKLAREKASDVKMLRQEQAAARREKLKQAYLKKKLEKLRASSKLEQT